MKKGGLLISAPQPPKGGVKVQKSKLMRKIEKNICYLEINPTLINQQQISTLKIPFLFPL